MKKVLSLVVAALFVSSSVFAASTQFTATASFSGSASFTFTLKNVQGDGAAQSLTWKEADAFNRANTDNWVRAQQYAEIVADITKANATVLMYTQNTTNFTWLSEYPNYNDGVVAEANKAYGGLVRNVNGAKPSDFDGQYRGYIPVLFSMNTQKNADITSDGTQITVGGGDSGQPVTRADRFMSEQANPSYSAAYATIAALDGPVFGITASGATWGGDCTDNTAYMYFFGNFKNIIGGDTYSTTVYVQQSWE